MHIIVKYYWYSENILLEKPHFYVLRIHQHNTVITEDVIVENIARAPPHYLGVVHNVCARKK